MHIHGGIHTSMLGSAAHLCAVAVLAPYAPRLVTPRASRVRLGILGDYDAALDKVYGGTAAPSIDPTKPSHLQLDLDEDGEAVLARFTYVDENTCIGCKNCALVARNTFLMEEELGKARVYAQGGDSDELIAEAIDSCPVNCIHYVSQEDLVTLETERAQKEVTINNYGDFKRAFTGGIFAHSETKAKYYDNPKLGARCTNCPSRGCQNCPMFGVGSNPVYLQRVAEREAKRQQSGQAAEAMVAKEREAMVGEIWAAGYAVEGEGGEGGAEIWGMGVDGLEGSGGGDGGGDKAEGLAYSGQAAKTESPAAAERGDADSVARGAGEASARALGTLDANSTTGMSSNSTPNMSINSISSMSLNSAPATSNSSRVGQGGAAEGGAANAAVSSLDVLFADAFDEEEYSGEAGGEPDPAAAIAAAAVDALFRDGYAGMMEEEGEEEQK